MKPAAKPNPYIAGPALTDPTKFYGRVEEVEIVFTKLRTMQSVSVVGERRIGKSSFLHYLCNTCASRLGQDYECHYLDLQRIQSAAEFYGKVCLELGQPGSEHQAFEAALKGKHRAGKKVVLCLDEFEATADDNGFGPRFFGVMRSLAQIGNLALVTATRVKLSEMGQTQALKTSLFENIFSYLRLGGLNRDEALELIRGPLKDSKIAFDDEDIKEILKLAQAESLPLGRLLGSGQMTYLPYRLNLACAELYTGKSLNAKEKLSAKALREGMKNRFKSPLNPASPLSSQRVWARQSLNLYLGRVASVGAIVGIVSGWLGFLFSNQGLISFAFIMLLAAFLALLAAIALILVRQFSLGRLAKLGSVVKVRSLIASVSLGFVVVLFVAVISLWVFRVIPKVATKYIFIPEKQILVSLTYPQYVASGDENELLVTMINCAKEPANGRLAVNFISANATSFDARPIEGKNLSVEYKDIFPQDKQTQRIYFWFPVRYSSDERVNMFVIADTGNKYFFESPSMYIAFLPYQKHLVDYLFGAGILLAAWKLVARHVLGLKGE